MFSKAQGFQVKAEQSSSSDNEQPCTFDVEGSIAEVC
jgi:hypothetical protein